MRPKDVVELVGGRLLPMLRTQQSRLDGVDEWLAGDNPVERAAHQDPNARRSTLASLSRTPMLRLIVEQLAQQLALESVSVATDDQGAEEALWAPWEANGCPSSQRGLYEAMIGYGQAFGLVLPGMSPSRPNVGPSALIRFLSPRQVLVVGSSDPFDEWPMYGLWETSQTHTGASYRFIDESSQHFLSWEDSKLVYLEERPHGIGVAPFVAYANHLDLEGRTRGEVERLEVVARRYDKTVQDRMLIQHNNSWRVRTATGLDDPGSIDEKERQKAKLRHDDVLTGGEGVQFGSLPETTLDSTLKAAEADQETLAAISQVTIWSLNSSKLINLSADALAEARSLNRLKIMALQRSTGRAHANLLRLAAHVEGRVADASRFDLTLEWENVEAQALSGMADALSKLDSLGVPRRFLWELIPGVSQKTVRKWELWIEKHPSREAILAQVLKRQTAAEG